MTQIEEQDDVDVTFEFTNRQMHALAALNDPGVDEVLYGGAKGGGKSVFLGRWSWLHGMEIANAYELGPSDDPPVLGWIGRKRAVDFAKSTLRTWQRFIPPDTYTIRQSARQIIVMGTFAIDFGGLDNTEDIQKFNSAEYAFFALDQAEECDRDDIAALRGSLRLVLDPARGIVPRKALFTANPAACWLKDEFIVRPKENQRFVRALPTDNPFLGPEYLKTLREAFGHRPELLRAYLDGSWEFLAGADQLIRETDVDAASGRVFYPKKIHKLVVCDPARFGDDETVGYAMEDTQIVQEEIYGQRDTMQTVGSLLLLRRSLGEPEDVPIIVDENGVGGGIFDRLAELGEWVIGLNPGASAADVDQHHNLRAEMWWECSRRFASGSIALRWPDPELRRQLTWPRYGFRNGRVLVEPKENIKERTNRSPDRADAFVMGDYVLSRLKGDRKRPDSVRESKPEGKPIPEYSEDPLMQRRLDRARRERQKEVLSWR